jgi:hypothetical protein
MLDASNNHSLSLQSAHPIPVQQFQLELFLFWIAVITTSKCGWMTPEQCLLPLSSVVG